VPREGLGAEAWGEQVASSAQWWHTVMAVALIAVIVRPDMVRRLLR
jgi:hypothetical protein